MLISNKKAYFNYIIQDEIECGVVLTGDEVKSIKSNTTNIANGYVVIKNNEVFVINWHVAEYKFTSKKNITNMNIYNPLREKKLLLHRNQINKLHGKTYRTNLTIVLTKCYVNSKNKIKVSIAIGEGRKKYDKREYIKSKDLNRESYKFKEI